MTQVEEPLLFKCAGDTLLGVVSLPPAGEAAPTVGVIIVVGGPQYRVGSHRQFVQLARSLSAAGHAVLRFDYRGMGDSHGERRGFEQVCEDIGSAVDALLGKVPCLRRLVLFGLCDGASAALLYLQVKRDARIAGLCLANPWVRSEATLARTHLKHYYRQRLADPAFWRKLFSGGVGLRRVTEFAATLRRGWQSGRASAGTAHEQLPFQEAMAAAWKQFNGRILLVLSADDLTAKEFVEHAESAAVWQGLPSRANVTRLDLADADHTLSNPSSQRGFELAMQAWLAPLVTTH